MLIYEEIRGLRAFLEERKKSGQIIGFVPTMGALHNGHISLIEEAKKQCDLVVCSIFVNPTQFNDKADLERYPRTPEADQAMLERAGCDVLFAPSVQEMYPEVDKRAFDFGFLDNTLDGAFRPGHFNGVGQIVSKLFDAVMPQKAFFGQKDYQQVLIVKELVKQLNMPVEIIACPIKREPDGLAMSSRNTLLNAEERKQASLIPQLMEKAKGMFNGTNKDQVVQTITNEVDKIPLFRLDYFEIRNAENLEEYKNGKQAVALIAVFCGKIRLIDNCILN